MEIQIRNGQMGQTGNTWDNGFYAKGDVSGVSIDFLVDNGSTMTLISKAVFDRLPVENQSTKSTEILKVRDANGNLIKTYGSLEVPIHFNGFLYHQKAVICDIGLDGILGQDFLLKFVTRINYKQYTLHTEHGEIQCYIYGKSAATCRIEVRATTLVPPQSGVWLPVDIPGSENLTSHGFAEPVPPKQTSLSMIPGVLDLNEKVVSVVNCTEEPVTLHAKQLIGTCESYTDSEESGQGHMVKESLPVNPEKPASLQLPEHLQDMFSRSSVHLDNQQKEALAQLLLDYHQVFAKSSEDLGLTSLVEHRINVGCSIPVRQPTRRQPLGKREAERTEVEKMLKRGIIEPSNSPWSSNVVLVTKKDGGVRFCVDYRVLNSLTKKDAYPLPPVSECLDALAGSKWFSTMDLNSGFWQVGLEKSSREYTAFSTSLGLFHFTVMPFGLVNSPSTFSRLVGSIFSDLQWIELLAYMDDILSMSQSFEEGIERLGRIFDRLLAANLKLKVSKCVFFQRKAHFLGHIASAQGIATDPEKISAIQDWLPCRTTKQCRSFLGLASYYRRFCPGFAEIARPLHKLCEKGRKFQWTSEAQEAFDKLKKLLTSPPVLAYPLPNIRFIVDTDSSAYSVGGVLSQIQNGHERVIAYMSKSMNQHEQNYCTTRKELLAVVIAFKTWHNYLYGQEILLRTDNMAVKWLRSLKAPTGQTFRWLQQLETYNFTTEHRAAKNHTTADALSRKPCKACERQEALNKSEEPSEEHICCVTGEPLSLSPPQEATRVTTRGDQKRAEQQLKIGQEVLNGWSPSDIRASQLNDPDIALFLQAMDGNTGRPSWNTVSSGTSAHKTLWRHWDRLKVEAGMLYREFTMDENSETILQLIIPADKRTEVVRYFHDIPSSGHLGAEKTLEKVRNSFYWPAMKQYIQDYCLTCDKCVAKKLPIKKHRAPLGQYLVGEPMERIQIDVLGPLPLSKNGNRFIVVVVDCFTKWSEAYAIPNQEAHTIIKVFVNEFVSRFGTPLQLHTDLGTNFQSTAFRQMCDLLHIDKTSTTAMRPQANGNVERFNRTLQNMLTSYCEDDQKRWDEYLPQVMMAYRASINSATHQTPAKMVLGRNVVLPFEAVIGKPQQTDDLPEQCDIDVYISQLQNRLSRAHDIARKHLKVNANYQKRHYDLRAKKRSFQSGQAVWLSDPHRKVGVCTKLTSKWKGPYLVLKRLDDITYLIKKSEKQRSSVFHIDRLEPYRGRNIPTWFRKEISKMQ